MLEQSFNAHVNSDSEDNNNGLLKSDCRITQENTEFAWAVENKQENMCEQQRFCSYTCHTISYLDIWFIDND